MDRIRRSYDESFRRYIVEEIEKGEFSRAEAAKEYGLTKAAIKRWLEEYGRFCPQHSVVEVVMKSEKERISELEKALAEAHLKIRVYDEILNLAGRKYKVDLKKTFGTVQREDLAPKGVKSDRSAKP